MDVLLVFPNDARRPEFEKALQGEGHTVRTFTTPSEALAAAGSEPPECAVLDGNTLAQALEGFRSSLESRCPGKAIPVVTTERNGSAADLVNAMTRLARSGGKAIDLSGKTILLVDDKDITRRRLSAQLSNDGWRVIEAMDGSKAALSIIDGRIDCLMVSAMLHGRPSTGIIRSAAEIRKAHPFPYSILVVTDLDTSQAAAKMLEAGADDIVGRASGFPVMARRLQVALNLRSLLRENRYLKEQLASCEISRNETMIG
jgi:DNA-binding response OmpR family regulator